MVRFRRTVCDIFNIDLDFEISEGAICSKTFYSFLIFIQRTEKFSN